MTKSYSSDVSTPISPPELEISFNKQTILSTDTVTINYSLKNISETSITLCFDPHSNLYALKDSIGIYEEIVPFRSHGACLESEIVKIPSQSSLIWTSQKEFKELSTGEYSYTAKIKSSAYWKGEIYSNPLNVIVSK